MTRPQFEAHLEKMSEREKKIPLDKEGRILFRTFPGTWNFDIDEWGNAIKKEIEHVSG
jgi:hypothetical protein